MPRSQSPSPRRERERDYQRSRDKGKDVERRERGRDKSRDRDRDRDSYRRSRSRSRSRSRERDSRRYRSRSPHDRSRSRSPPRRRRFRSRSSNSDSDDSDSGSEREKDRKRRKDERKEKKRHKKEKRDKKERKREKKKSKLSSGAIEWGKYGLIDVSDLYNKTQEFSSYLTEHLGLNPETMSKEKEKNLFKDFVEGYNTATLPHEKYYDFEKWEKKLNSIKMGETISAFSTYDPRADMESLRSRHTTSTKASGSAADFLSKEKLEELRKVERERVEGAKMKRLGMHVKEGMGVRWEDE